MNFAFRFLLVTALVLMFVPHSFANDWLAPDIMTMFEAASYQTDALGTKNNLDNRSAGNPTDTSKTGKQTAGLVVKCSPQNDWVPLDIIRMFEAPAFQPKWYAGTN